MIWPTRKFSGICDCITNCYFSIYRKGFWQNWMWIATCWTAAEAKHNALYVSESTVAKGMRGDILASGKSFLDSSKLSLEKTYPTSKVNNHMYATSPYTRVLWWTKPRGKSTPLTSSVSGKKPSEPQEHGTAFIHTKWLLQIICYHF